MTQFYNCQISQFPLHEENQHQSHIPLLSLGTSNTTSPYPFFLHNQQDHRAHDHGDLSHHQTQLQEEYVVHEGDQKQQQQGPVKWMSSKMRIMRKMMNSDQTPKIKTSRRSNHQHQDQKQESIIRVCSDCNTTKTPLWRSGPHGPKSLCNACGIRQRKARRAMAASAMSSGIVKDEKDMVSDIVDRTVPFKKRCRFATAASETTQRKLCFEDIVISLNKSSAFHRVFPQDEKDAAILLMALSCGLLCSS